jgi:hypothetical protein
MRGEGRVNVEQTCWWIWRGYGSSLPIALHSWLGVVGVSACQFGQKKRVIVVFAELDRRKVVGNRLGRHYLLLSKRKSLWCMFSERTPE